MGHAPGRQGLRDQAGERRGTAEKDFGAGLMAEKLSLGDYQRDLAERLRAAEGSRSSSMLALQVGEQGWLVDLADAGEVIHVPPITAVPLTRAWFKGVTNIRGNLYSVVDFPAFLRGSPLVGGGQPRLPPIGDRLCLGRPL